MDVLKDAARFRPPTPLKLGFFDKLLSNSMQQQATEASPMLVTGLRVVNIFMASFSSGTFPFTWSFSAV